MTLSDALSQLLRLFRRSPRPESFEDERRAQAALYPQTVVHAEEESP